MINGNDNSVFNGFIDVSGPDRKGLKLEKASILLQSTSSE